jgi:hypothetical protein
MVAYGGSGGTAPCTELGTRWRWVVTFASRPLYPAAKDPLVPIGQEAGWAPEPSGGGSEEKIPSPYRTRTPDHPARSQALYHWAIQIPEVLYEYFFIC